MAAASDVDQDFVRHLDAFSIHGAARDKMLEMSLDERLVLLAKWKRGTSYVPPTQKAPPRMLSSISRSNSGKSLDGSEVTTAPRPQPSPRIQSRIPARRNDQKMNLNIALHWVLDSSGITGESKQQVLSQATEEQKQQIVDKFFSRVKEEEGNTQLESMESDVMKIIDEMPEDSLDEELEIAFSDPDINITGSVGSNLIRNMSDGSKRHFLKQYVKKKNEGPEKTLKKLSQRSLLVASFDDSAPASATDEASLWRQAPEFFLKNISRREGIDTFLDCEVDVDGLSRTWSDSLDAALERLTTAGPPGKGSYRDSVNVGEIKLSAVQCLSILVNHSKAVEGLLSSFSLLTKITSFLLDFPEHDQGSGSDSITYIKLKMAVVEVLGPVCLFSEDGFRLVLNVLEAISQDRRSHSRFLPMVSSILNPLLDREGYEQVDPDFLNIATDPMKYFGDQELIWNFRSAYVIFLVALTSASEEPLDRLRIRFEIEAGGLNLAFRSMMAWDPPAIVREHVDLYYEDKAEDTEEVQQVYKDLNLNERTPEEVLSWLMELLTDVQFSNYAYHLVLKTMSNLAHLTSLLATDPTKFHTEVTEEIMREETLDGLAFLQELSSELYESNSSQKDDVTSALKKRDRKEKTALRIQELAKRYFGAIDLSLERRDTVEAKHEAPERKTSIMSSPIEPKRTVSFEKRTVEPVSEVVADVQPITQQESAFYTGEIEKLKRKKTMAITLARRATTKVSIPESPLVEAEEKPNFQVEITKGSNDQKIRSIRWTKIPDEMIKGTIWEEIVAESYYNAGPLADVIVDGSEKETLAGLFTLHDQYTAPEETKPILDPKRSRNIEILLRGLRIPFITLRDAVLEADDEMLTIERLEVLSRCVPTVAEIETVTNYDGTVETLGYVERFIVTFAGLETPLTYVDALILRKNFDEEVAEIITDMTIVTNAAASILSSQRLKRVLRHVLVIGNYLNGFDGGVVSGFGLGSLVKLMEIRADEGSPAFSSAPTLMHYVAKRLYEIDEDALALSQDLEGLDSALKDLMESANSLNNRITALRALLQSRETSGPLTNFDVTLSVFSSTASDKVSDLMGRLEDMETQTKNLTRHFASDLTNTPTSKSTTEIFKTLSQFTKMLTKSHTENLESLSTLHRQALLQNPLMRNLHEAKSKLKPVPNQLPFSRRLTMAPPRDTRSNLSSVLSDAARGGGGGGGGGAQANLTRMSREPTMFKTVLAARKTARRSGTRVARVGDDGALKIIQDLI
ncbi:Delphilin [Dinochytrium kinnereticum]|nr:Delphilin [Dinochytrium kinnereticum]